ncbi:tetratricopeptide repeat protein [Blastopirellula marina]|uniref:tetratricopeptide repeat protein n=1 Tax=Blastopirellula marina TaxID=124 RepID=UPI0013049B79|nr:tetratricopeptide repeat protein [Blastopirellula marina]
MNYRFIALLLLASAIVIAGGYGLHTFQMTRHKEAFLREARRVRDEGRRADALALYRRYTLVAPTDVEALAEFGQVLKEVGSNDQAYLILSRAFALDHNRDALRRDLADLAIGLGRFTDASDLISGLIENHSDDPSLYERLAVCQSGLGEYQLACDSLSQAIKGDPKNRTLYLRLAALRYSAFNRYIEAKAALDEMVEADPQEPLAYVTRGHWILSAVVGAEAGQQGRVESASLESSRDYRLAQVQADVQKALELAPASVDANLLSAELALVNRDLVTASEFANRAKRITPGEAYPVRLLIRIASMNGDSEKAIELSREAVKKWPNDFQLQWMLANLLIDKRDVDQALPVVERIRELTPNAALAALLDARLLAIEGKWLESAKVIEQNRAQLMNWPAIASRADFHLGRCYQKLARPDQELNAYRRALAADPNSRDLRLAVANSLRDASKFEEAFEEYRVIVEDQASDSRNSEKSGIPFEAVVNYFRLLIREETMKSKSQSLDQVSKALDRLEERYPDLEFLPILRAEVLVSRGEMEQAAELVQTARKKAPGSFEYLSADAMLACQIEDWSAVDEILRDGKKQFGSDARYWMLAGKCAMLRYGTEAGPQLKAIAQDLELQDVENSSAVVSYLANLSFWIQDFKLTKELGQQVVEADSNQLAIRLLLLEVAFKEEDLKAVEPLLAQVEAIDGQHATWQYGEAVRLALASELDEGEKPNDKRILKVFSHLAEAEKLRPGWSRPITFEAHMLEKQGQEDMALSKYEDAIALGERDPVVLRRTTALLFKRGRFAEVDSLLAQLNDNGSRISADLLHVGAEAAMQLGNMGRALQLAQDLAGKSGKAEDHVWLAQLFMVLGNTDSAAAELTKAIEIAPSKPESWLGMVSIYARNKQRDLALEAIQEGTGKIDEAQRGVFQGQSYEILGDLGRAESSYRAAIIQRPEDMQARLSLINFYLRTRRSRDATQELQGLLKSEINDELRFWARRNLAVQLAMVGRAENVTQALQLLDENEKQFGTNRQDQIARASILATQPLDESKASAIKTLEQVGQASLSVDEQFLLAKLYATHEEYTKASRLLRGLVIRPSADAKYLRTYIAVLIKNKEESDAQLWLHKLESAFPAHVATVDLQTSILFLKQKYDQIPVLLGGWLDSDATSEEKGMRGRSIQIEWAANRLEQLAMSLEKENPDTANSFRAQAKELRLGLNEPDVKLERAKILVAQKQYGAALDLLKDLAGKVPARDFSRTLSYLVGQNPSVTILEDADRILDDAQKKYSHDLDILAVVGDVALLRGEFAKSREIFQEVLRESPDDVHVLNNCALAIAFEGGDSEEAIRLANKAVSLGGEAAPLLDTRGVVYLSAGDAPQAMADLKQAIAENPLPEYFFHLALAQKQAGLTAEYKTSLDVVKSYRFSELSLHACEKAAYEALISAN